MQYRHLVTLFLTIGGVFSACGTSRTGPAMTPASGTRPSQERAADAIARATCDHEERCGRVGWERDYPNRGGCLNDARQDALRRLNACPQGPNQDEVQECLDAVAQQDCGTKLGRVDGCGSDELCRESETFIDEEEDSSEEPENLNDQEDLFESDEAPDDAPADDADTDRE